MNQKKPQQKSKLVQVIGLYLLCLLAAFCTWIAVMYAEEKAQTEKAQTDTDGQTLCAVAADLPADDGVYISL